ncbi:MAG: serine/threonine-protein kinase [Pseudomonadota bacterium]
MTDRYWTRLWQIFEAAVELPEDQRQSYLSEACADDPALHERVEALLASDAREAGLLDAELDTSSLVADAVNLPDTIGAYRIVRELGRGGMGQVFLGERDDPQFKQQVAIKLIPLGRYSDAVQKRFVLERQILSDLDHPLIARLLDGGVTDEGIPYLIMEHIDGVPIDEYCADHHLGLKERLKLFQHVCRAVDYAHRNLVVHRDIKPGNVLVDTRGRVKLLDFGVAKLVEPAPSETVDVTETVGRMATPEYASPEQLRGERLSTATDVYSLGVLLYQLLTGKRPIKITRSDLAATLQAIEAEQPVRPSQLQPSDAYAPPPRLLAGDLDNIVLLALRKDPERRYASAADFAEDIQRYLDGFPVLARPEALGYRAGKFFRRHRLGVTVSALAAAAVFTLAVTSFLQARSLEAALAEANLEQQKATQVADFMRDLFKASDPVAADASDRSTEQLLADGAARIREELAEQPALQASLMRTMADVYVNRSQYENAQSLAQDALTIYASISATGSAEALETRLTLAKIAFLLEDFDAALADCQAVAEHPAVDRPTRISARLQCASALSFKGNYEASGDQVAALLAGDLTAAGASDDQVAEAHTIAGNNHWYLANYDEARQAYTIAYELVRRSYGEEHPKSIAALNRIGSVDLRSGDLDQAETIHRDVLEKTRTALGRLHSQTANATNGLGVVLLQQGNYAEAEPLFTEAVEIFEALQGADSAGAMRPMINLALAYTETQRYDEAIPIHEELLRREIEAMGPDFWRVGLHYNNAGLVYQDLRDLKKAEDAFRKARAVIRKAWGATHPGLAYSVNNLAIVLHDQGRDEEAEPLFELALKLRREGLEPDHPALAATLHEYGRLLIDQGRLAEATPMVEQALTIRREKLQPDDWRTLHTQALKGALLARQGAFETAEPLLIGAYTGLEKELGPGHWRTRDTRQRTQSLYLAWDRPQDAERFRPNSE